MKQITLTLLAFIFILSCNKKEPASKDDRCFCADSTSKLCALIPHEVFITFGDGYSGSLDSVHQPPFDEFSWQSFVALNWPADDKGQPLPGDFKDDPSALRVWEYYKDPVEVFDNTDTKLKALVSRGAAQKKKTFYMMSKSPQQMHSDGSILDAIGFPIIDRNLNFAIFEEKINPDEANFIVTNHLTSKAGIAQYAPDGIDLPEGTYEKDRDGGIVGAIELKATWRLLDSSDDKSRYYTRDATIHINAANSETGSDMEINATVGLVALHIIHKTRKFPAMVWSTFEHVDNTPTNIQEAQNKQSERYSFYNPECLTCPANKPPALQNGEKQYKWAATPPYAFKYSDLVRGEAGNKRFGTQVSRVYPVYFKTEQINKIWRKKLKGTVWENYKLIGSQWRRIQDGPPFLATDAPNFLANTTLETYDQQNASCLGCHAAAHIRSGADSITTDFSFLFPHYAK